MKSETLKDALIEELKDILHAEKQLTKALPKMAKAAASVELAEAIREHLEETATHVERIERAFELLGENAKAKTCDAMKGLIEEGSGTLKEHDKGAMRDAMIIASAQKVEHYEIASYGTVIAWAEQLGLSDVAEVLGETLEEEKAADETLNGLASTINAQAEAGVMA